MVKFLTVSEAKPKLGKLLDSAGAGRPVYLRRKSAIYRIEPVAFPEPIPVRPVGYFAIEADDPFIALANSAKPTFVIAP